MWSQVVCCELDIDLEAFVAEDSFLFAEDWVCKSRMKIMKGSEIIWA
jgi:hypothetical protein